MAAELRWKRSSYSGDSGTSCVECAADGRVVRIRDSKDRSGRELRVPVVAWSAFVAFARA